MPLAALDINDPSQLVARVKLRKGTFSCFQCKNRKKRCIPSASGHAKCRSCQRLGCPCVSQERRLDDIRNSEQDANRRIERVESLIDQLVKQQQQARDYTTQRYIAGARHALTGAGEDRLSRCRSLSGYFYSTLPHPFIASLMEKHGEAAYEGVREPLRLSKTSRSNAHELQVAGDVTPAILARKLIRLAVSLIYMDSTCADEVSSLQLDASALEVAERYVEAARHLTAHNELLQSIAGLEAVMMEGHYSVHLGRLHEAGDSFRRALYLAKRTCLPERANMDDEEGLAARRAGFRLLGANRSMSLNSGYACEDVDDEFTTKTTSSSPKPCEQLDSLNVQLWRRIISRNVRIRSAWRQDASRNTALQAELDETLRLDQELRHAMLAIPSTWWALPDSLIDPLGTNTEASFSELNATKDHYYTIVLTHLPYVLPKSAFDDLFEDDWPLYAYSRAAAASACREVLLRFPYYQTFKHVPASYRALERKTFLAGVVLLLAHMESHQSLERRYIEHERPRDLNALTGAVNAMEDIFSRDRQNPRSDCAQILRKLQNVEQDMAYGMPYVITSTSNAAQPSASEPLDLEIPIPYFGTVRIQPEYQYGTLQPYVDGA